MFTDQHMALENLRFFARGGQARSFTICSGGTSWI